MSKFRSRKLKGGQPQMNTPPVKPPPLPAPQPSSPLKPPPNPVKTPPPGVGAAAKTLQTAEEGISFFEQYGYQMAIGCIVLLILCILGYYFFIRDIPGQGDKDKSSGTTDTTKTDTTKTDTKTDTKKQGDSKTKAKEGFTVDMVNDMTEEDGFEPGRPDQWMNEKQQLLPGMNI